MKNFFAGTTGVDSIKNFTPVFFDTKSAGMLALWCRLFFYVAGFFGVILIQIHQQNFLDPNIFQPFNLLMVAAFGAQVGFAEAMSREGWARRVLAAMFFFDALIVNLVMWVFGTQNSVFLFLLLLISVGAALSLGFSFGLKTSLWSLTLLNLHFALNPLLNPDYLRSAWFVDTIAIFAVTGVAGLLGEQLQYVAKDIEQKREEIETLTNINDLIVDNVPSGLLLIDSGFTILRANRGAAKIFEDLGLEGRKLADVYVDLQNALAANLNNLGHAQISRGHHRLELDFYNVKREKSILEVIWSQAAKNEQGQQDYVVLLQNVTELKSLQFQLSQKEKLAAVGQLAAGIAHEIRNPLASISGSIQLLQANLVTQSTEDGKLFRIVLKEIDRLNGLITEFLDFVRPEVRVEDPIDINGLAKEILDMTRLNPNLNKKVQQRTELRAAKVVRGHHDKLKQALLNIVINAYQAMSDTLHPELWLRSYDSDDGRVVLEIQDNGSGISRDHINRIFEPFHTTKAGGTGLGLAITHKIIESHDADIHVSSEWGHGAKFTIVFNTREIK